MEAIRNAYAVEEKRRIQTIYSNVPVKKFRKRTKIKKDKINDFLGSTTSYEIRDNIFGLLDNMRIGAPPQLDDESPSSKAAYHQARMGQRATTNGMWLNSWKDVQDTYLKRMNNQDVRDGAEHDTSQQGRQRT